MEHDGDRGKPPATSTQFGVGVSARPGAARPALSVSEVAHVPTSHTAPAAGDTVAEHLAPGTVIEQYELIRELGRGGMGIVFAARDTKLGRRVAIKFLRNASREVAERFLIEARATAQCSHDNIVIIHEVDEYEDMPYMVLEFLEGQTLRDLMGEFGEGIRLPPSRVVELALPIARALARAHELGIVHRDLKPENVIVTEAGQVKVLDFGIAKALGNHDGRDHAGRLTDLASGEMMQTREGAIVGTLPYMSPEQMGSTGFDHRSDLWALGIVMFEMLAGRHPVDPLTSDALIHNLVTPEPMASIRAVAADVPDGLAELVDGLLHKTRDARIASAAQLAGMLEELQPGRRGRMLGDGESPYPGLTAFQEADANRFFGRSRDVTRMVARIRELPLTGVIGPSGVGKSSFVRAGVGPALKASGERWDVVTLRPGRHPLSALASVIERVTTRSAPDAAGQLAEHHALVQRLYTEPGYLGALLRHRARDTGGHILLFVDQFEELYTLVPNPDERRAFTAALAGAADDPAAPLRVVVSMRSDFLDRIAEDPRFMEELSRGLVFLSSPDRDGLREALVQPVEMVGHRFETSAMVGEMLDALAGIPGALPLLQFAAAKLWDARDRERRLLTASSYHAIGGISGALATHADEVIAGMSASSQRLAQRIFRQLVTPERTRAIVELSDLGQLGGGEDLARVIDQLVAARLLVVQTRADAGGGSVEIVHESLIDRWPMLRRWLDEDQEDAAYLAQLGAAAKQWDGRGRPSGLLWRGDAMEEAKRWYAQRTRSIAPRDQAFLDAVFALARRGRTKRRVALISAFAIMGIVAAGASVAYVRVRAAEQTASEQAARAHAEAARAKEALANEQREQAQRLAAEARASTALEDTLKARAEVRQKSDQVKLTAEELEAANAKLELKVREAHVAREKAERAMQTATRSTAEARRLNTELQRALAIQRARVKALEDEKKKLTTKLKE